MNLNKVILIGRLTQDPEVRSTPSGQTVGTIRLATNRVWNNQQTGQKQEATEFHTIVAWGRLAEIASQYLKRGGLVMIEGRLQTRSWTGTDNVKRYATEIVAENLQMGPRSASSEGGYQQQRPAAAPAAPATQQTPADEIPIIDENELARQGVEEGEVAVKDSDLPF